MPAAVPDDPRSTSHPPRSTSTLLDALDALDATPDDAEGDDPFGPGGSAEGKARVAQWDGGKRIRRPSTST